MLPSRGRSLPKDCAPCPQGYSRHGVCARGRDGSLDQDAFGRSSTAIRSQNYRTIVTVERKGELTDDDASKREAGLFADASAPAGAPRQRQVSSREPAE